MSETIHCGICGQAIHEKNFKDGMAKLRRHRKKHHPRAFAKSIAKSVQTRKANRK